MKFRHETVSLLSEARATATRIAQLSGQNKNVLPVARAALYETADPQSPICFAQRPAESKNHRNMWELLGGKLEKNKRYPNSPDLQWESSSERATLEISQEATLAYNSFAELDVPVYEHQYLLDDPVSHFNGYLVWTMVHTFALNHPSLAKNIRTPEHQNHVWLTAEEALDAYQSGRFDLHPQSPIYVTETGSRLA